MVFRLGHDELCRLVDSVVGTVPIDDYAIDAAADHVINLALYLGRIGGTIADIHVVGLSEPEEQVSVNLGRGSPVKQRMNIHLADVSGASVAIGLTGESIGGACVIRGLCRERRGRHDIRVC